MAADAIARQYDVNRHLMTYSCEPGKGGYRPGLITFEAKTGKSIDIEKIRQSITATRLSGGTNMSVDYFEITATGETEKRDQELLFNVSGTGQLFVLGESPTAKGALQKLRDALSRGEKVERGSGRIQGWSGRFPDVLRKQATALPTQHLLVTDFQTGKK